MPLTYGKWKPIRALTDDFGETAMDESKWYPYNPDWKGREPGYFNPISEANYPGLACG
jgi:hypothetical protein